jgi:hypothetical protein
VLRDELIADTACLHDRHELSALTMALREWGEENSETLNGLEGREYREFVAAVTPEGLIEQGLYIPRDGLRSAFDPAHAERFQRRMDGWDTLIGGENTLKESSHEWVGLWQSKAEPLFGENEEWQEVWLHGWIVAATKGPWVRGGRYVVRQRPTDAAGTAIEEDGSMSLRVSWMPEHEYQALSAANRRGEVRVFASERPESPVPEWQARHDLELQMDGVEYIRRALERKRNELGEGFTPTFRNGTREELRLLIGDSADYVHTVPHKLTIETTEEGIRVRYTEGTLWVEANPKGQLASWQTE